MLQPLVFMRLEFWVFFAIVMGVFSLIYQNKSIRNAWLFAVSLFFYWTTSQAFISILLFSTISDYFIGFKIHENNSGWRKKSWLALSIFLNLFMLVYFKYAYFFTDSINNAFGTNFEVTNHFAYMTNQIFGSNFRADSILLPVGISFFTFQTMSYSIDIYRGEVKPVKNILDFGFYVSFFPQLVAGPIVRAADFIPQLYQEYKLTREQFGIAVFWILNGLIKKIFLADYIATNFNDRIFSNPLGYTGFEGLMALYGYSLQVYADFSGYTDIAIGVALLMGFRLPVNFNSPYKADSAGNFWRRWHISLSTWLKDYLYIPMGGNRGGSLFTFIMLGISFGFISLISGSIFVLIGLILTVGIAILLARFIPVFKNWLITNINVMLTMLIGGLWHGASWNFVVWGGLNGVGIVVYKLWRKISPWESKNTWYKRAWAIFLTFNFITFTRIWFRSESFEKASQLIHQIQHNFTPEIIPDAAIAFWKVFAVMIFGYIVHWLPSSFKTWYKNAFVNASTPVQVVISFVVVIILYQVVSSDMQPFIYFQF
ncbi:MBOAT family protein [bacterium SCSIO 12643]|nr:MBOAT family protein [bacterium SCSIO 12643]